MRNLQEIISTRLLPFVQQPGQFVGHEFNARCGDVETAELTVAMCFPDAYTIGISHYGSQLLYHRLNDMDGVAADRAYCPPPEAERIMREHDVPLFGWESRRHLGDFDVLGFSLGYELCVMNVLTMLNLAGLPQLAADRNERHPLIVGGDALADSPEPLADFFDVFLPGDGEKALPTLVQFLQKIKQNGETLTRSQLLRRIMMEIPSAYVPRFYQPDEHGCPRPVDDAPAVIQRACLSDLKDSPLVTDLLAPVAEGVQERVVIEVMRGCPNACRFCQAGFARLPVRHRSHEDILAAARTAVDATGFREISLLSLSTSDYPDLEGLLEKLNAEFTEEHVSISLPSLRVDSQLQILPKLTSQVRKGGLTIAAEAGSERLRRVINKRITEENMLAGVTAAWRAGFGSVKVYFMAGLPSETLDDIDAIADLAHRLSITRREVDGHKGAISASVSWFVPKPHTPLQYAAMPRMDYYFAVREKLIARSKRSPVNVKFHRIERSLIEALIARADRSLGKTLLAAWNAGARMDGWNEYWDEDIWFNAIEQTGADLKKWIHTPITPGTPTPWSHIQCHISEDKLAELYHRAMEQA